MDEKNEEVKVNQEALVKKDRDISIDLIRVIACLLVVGVHLCLQAFNEYYHEVDWSRLFEKCFLTDGVPLFFMITGFFITNGRSYKKIWKSTFFKVIITSLIYVVFAQIFYMFIINKESFLWCIKNAAVNLNLKGIFQSIITADVKPINSLCEHLWYIYTYVGIIILFPLLWLICKEEKWPTVIRRVVLTLGVANMILIDIDRFYSLPFIGVCSLFDRVLVRAIIYVLCGYELFLHKDKIKGNKAVSIFTIIIFILTNIVRYKLENHLMVINSYYNVVGRASFVEWRYTALNIISGIALFVFFYSISINSEKMKSIIEKISAKTFGIYLIHYMLIAKVDLYKFDKIGKLYKEILYLIISIPVTFIASYLIVAIIECIKKKSIVVISKMKKQENV